MSVFMHDETSDPSQPDPAVESAASNPSSHLVDESSIAAEPKIRIGSQRPQAERPKADRAQSERVKAVAEQHLHEGGAPKKTPVPSIRAGLPADLEQEVADALEGFS